MKTSATDRAPQPQEEQTMFTQPQGEQTMKTTETKQRKTGLGVLLLTALAMTGANAAILHGIPGGDLIDPPMSNPINGITFTGSGQWHTSVSDPANDTVALTGSGSARHIALQCTWYPEAAKVWYTDDGTTPTDTAWNISSELSWSGGRWPVRSMELLADTGGDTLSFGIDFEDKTASWHAGSQSGTFTSATGLDTTRRTLGVVYNPVTGWATGSLGAEQIFNVNAGTGLLVKRVQVSDWIPNGGAQDSGTLSVYNITATAVPEPAALGLLALGALGLLRRRSER